MKSANMKVTLALVLSSTLAPISALADNITWTIKSSSFSSGNISGSFIWNNSGSGSIVSNNVVLTVGGVAYNSLVAGDQTSFMSLWASNAVNSKGVFITKAQLGTLGNLSGVTAYIGSCQAVGGSGCNNMINGYETGAVYLTSFSGPDAARTTLAMIANQNALRSLLSQRSSAIMTMMDYDCETFDAKGYCVSFRARYTAMDSQNEGAGVFTAAYRASEKVRIGGFVDYRASEKDGTAVKQGDTMPTVGAFAAYSHSGNATGFQAKASAAYNSGKVTVTRAGSFADNTEAGSGKAGLNSYAIGAELAWGFAVSPTMLATPYAGIRYSDATRKGYTEGTVTGTVDFPITYDAYYQRLTTATAGVRLSGMFSDKVGYQASLGGEYDLAHKASTYSGTSTIPGLENFALANTGASNRSRVVASAGVHYQLDKTQRLTATVGVRGQAYSSQPSVTTLVGYQVAF